MKLKHLRHRIPISNRIVAATDIAEKKARLTNIGAKKARLCGYRTPYNGPTVKVQAPKDNFAVIFLYFGVTVEIAPLNYLIYIYLTMTMTMTI